MRPRDAIFVLIVGCGGQGSTARAPSSAPAPAAPNSGAPASPAGVASSATPVPQAVPTGGSVLVGEIPASKQFDPRPAIETSKPALLDCYNRARARVPDLSGKLKLRLIVNQAGAAVAAEAEPGGSVNDPALVACVCSTLKTLSFPRPGGMATVIAPLAFRP